MADQYDEELERIRKEKLRVLLEEQQKKVNKDMGRKWPQTPIPVTDGSIVQIIKEYPLIVIDCWAPWCGPCYAIAPVIEELAREYTGKIVFGKLNVDENRYTSIKYKIMSIPTMLIFKNGKLVEQVIGAMPRQELEPIIAKHLDGKG